MKKITLGTLLLIGCSHFSMAQTETMPPSEKKEKMVDQFIGVQVNDLLRQVFNFNGSTSPLNTNPYLLTYSINSRTKGWGLRAGIGYNYSSTSSNDGITSVTNNLNDLSARVGIEKACELSGKWTAGFGLDLVYTSNDDHTVSTVSSNITPGITPFTGNDVTDTKTTSHSMGGGPQGWVRYSISKRILIGTESSFYYTTGDQQQTITIDGFTTSSPSSNGTKHGTFNTPIAVFLHVKF